MFPKMKAIKSENGDYIINVAEKPDEDGDVYVEFYTNRDCMRKGDRIWFYDLAELEQIRDLFVEVIEEFKRVQEKPLT